jgi:phosphoribosylformimino-5-aminoimidazole carboxamide ribotide isomerase
MFRPCIDLHEGKVKQIVGGTLGDSGLKTNFVSDRPATWYAELYRRDNLRGGHIIMLGPGNGMAARQALEKFPGGMQIGGGIDAETAHVWIDAGASHVVITSWIFREGRFDHARLAELVERVGKSRLVLDLSCRKRADDYVVMTDRWRTYTEMTITAETLQTLAKSCAEFLIHAVDVEGLCRGIDGALIEKLGQWSPIPVTYAGGANSLADLEETTRLGRGRVDLTIGSALDIFGGSGVKYIDVVAFNKRQRATLSKP